MSPLVPNGVYKIHNLEFKHYVADLTDGATWGPVSGIKDLPDNEYDSWKITNDTDEPNKVTIESTYHPGYYAYAEEYLGAGLFASKTKMTWTIVQLSRGYYIESPSGEFVWELPQGADGAQIVLDHFTKEDNEKWTFTRLRF